VTKNRLSLPVTCSNMAEKYSNLFRRLVQNVRRRKIISMVVLVLVLAGFAAWRADAAKSTSGGYLAGKVAYGDITSAVSVNATVEPTEETVLSFKNSGYVENVYVTKGQFVKAGTVLAKEQSSDYQAQLDEAEAGLESAQANYGELVAKQPDQVNQAKAQLAQAQSNLDLAKTTLAQDEALYAAGAISRSTLSSAQNACQNDLAQYQSDESNLNEVQNTAGLTQAADSVKTAKAQVTLARNNLSGSDIVATMDGYVVDISGNTGQYTEGGASSSSSSSSTTSSSQFTITLSSNKLELLAEVNEADIAKVSTGDKVTFTVDAYADKTYTGAITSLAAEATEVQSVEYFESYVSIDDQTGLKAGLPATVDIISSQKSHVLLVPRSAVDYGTTFANGKSGSFVVVVSNGKQQLTPVRTGLKTDSEVEIESGLTAGQEVVLSSQGLTSSGTSSSSTKNSGSQTQGPGIPGAGPMPGGN